MEYMSDRDGYLIPDWSFPDRVKGFITTTSGAPSGPAFNGLTLGHPDYLTQREGWLKGWQASLAEDWGWKHNPDWPVQVHGKEVIAAGSGRHQRADAVWTEQSGYPCVVMTADCLPVFFCNQDGSRIGVAHAGWRGLAAGVIEQGVAAMSTGLDAQPDLSGWQAWLGPAISQVHFEVGPEVREQFISRDADAVKAFVPGEGDRWFGDLCLLARQRLGKIGITDVQGGKTCTYREHDLHSYRRDGKASGRIACAIWIDG